MSVRVDLLKPEEFRHQGAVSREFAIRVSAIGGGALLLLLVVIGLVNNRIVRGQLADCTQTWNEMEPRYKRVRAMQEELAGARAVLNDLQAWNTSRLEWHQHMDSLQRIVPPSIQLTKMSVRSEFLLVPDEKKPDDDDAKLPVRRFSLEVDGKTEGNLADKVVVEFVDALRGSSSLGEVFESVRLQGLQQAPTTRDESGQKLFGIEAMCQPRKM